MWWIYALLSAFFASLTAIFAKVGVKDIDSDLATAIRIIVILILAWGIALFKGAIPGVQNFTKQNWTIPCLVWMRYRLIVAFLF
jgi:transporter family protein